jgi:lysophospholipase L1-like esterase
VTATTVLTFRLTVTDNLGATGTDTVNVTVQPGTGNQPPTANAGPDQTVIQGTLVQLNGSGTDPEGGPLTYQWTQTAGPAVVLGNATTATPSFIAPSVTTNTVLTFQLTVTDNQGAAATDLVNVTVQAAQTSSNIAALAAVTASSENTSTGQLAIKAVDGVVDGYPGDYTREWATVGEGVGAWLKLAWGSAYTLDHVVLYDRPNSTEQITSATLSFSDGSSVAVGALNNNGTGVTVNFSARTVTSLTMTVTGVSSTSQNIGLAEIEVYGSPAGSGNQPPTANAGPEQSANVGAAVQLYGSGSDSDGTIAGYAWTQTAGPSVTLIGAATATPSFTAPAVTATTVLTFRLTVTDNLGATGTDTVNVTVQPGTPGNLPPVASNACTSTAAGVGIGNGMLTATDPENQALTFELLTNGTKGSATVYADGRFTYTPYTNLPSGDGQARGMDKFTYRVTDTSGLSATGTVWVLLDGKVRIMPLGDSITAGVTSNDLPATGDRIGYRYDLYTGLTALSAGKYGIDFVGSQSDGSNYTFDLNHEGHPGWCDDLLTSCSAYNGISENVISFLNANPADVILLHIGTNGFNTDNTGVNSILNNINTWAQSNYPVTVMVARIIPATDGSLNVQTFNNNVALIATDRPFVKVFMVDEQSELHMTGDPTGNYADLSLMASLLHPNAAGYTKMANRWQADLITDRVLPSCP